MNEKRSGTVYGVLAVLVLWALLMIGGVMVVHAAPLQATSISFTGKELLSRPTDTSIMITIVPATTIEYFYEYGTASGTYPYSTTLTTATAGAPSKVVITGLITNTHYFYRMKYHLPLETDWVTRPEYSFWTQRAKGSTFVFDVTSDAHVGNMGTSAYFSQTMRNVANDHPDFHLDLGDTFMTDSATTVTATEALYLARRPEFGVAGNSAAIFCTPGNHEQEEGWNFDDPANQPVLNMNARKKYFPNPIPDGFYTGDTDTSMTAVSGDHLRENYYAWTWGDALFVAIDPFQYTMKIPYAPTAGEPNDEGTPTNDCWTWTLGKTQYDWLKQTLESSDATFKFVFAHQMVGGSQTYVRGGAAPAHKYEWGGYNSDGTTWAFDTKRSGWAAPIRQLLIDNGVSAFLHGHDHQYGYEVRDGIVYQACPSAGFAGAGFGIYSTGVGYCVQAMNSGGHLRFTVTPAQVTVEYIAESNGAVNYTYYIGSPTAMELTSLAAEAARGHVRVSWDAASEVDSVGFHVWRGTSARGERERLNESLIPSQAPGSDASGHYQFVDESAQPGLTYYYWVEQVRVDGTTHMNGPVSGRAGGYTKLPPARE
jgi:hypothetical protein